MSDDRNADANATRDVDANATRDVDANATPDADANAGPGDEPMPEGKEPPPPGFRIMAVVRWALVLAMAIVAVASVVHGFGLAKRGAATASAESWYCPMHPSVVQDHPGECPICGMSLVKREATDAAPKVSHEGHRHVPTDPYACPMHPEETGLSANDRCPICRMRLEPRATIDAGTDAAFDAAVPGLAPIELGLDRIQLIGMKTAKATREPLVPELQTVGFVTAPEQGLAKVTTKYAGWIESLVVAETGRKVKRGELLAVAYSPQVYLAAQEYVTAKGFAVGGGPHDVDGGLHLGSLESDARKRLELLGMSKGEIDALDKTGKARRTIGVYAPTSGYVIGKSAVIGLAFQPGTELFSIADLSKVWVLADVYEHELARVAVGQAATLKMLAYPDRVFTGEVKLVFPNVDPVTRTAKVRVELANDKLELRPGMYGDVSIALPKATGVVVPREAVVDVGDMRYVFVDKGSGRFEPRRVVTGVRAGEKVEIKSGVAEGEIVVTTGNFLLDSESRVRAAIEGGH